MMATTSPSNLRSQLDGLSLNPDSEKHHDTKGLKKRAPPATKSLLSSSLAAENFRPTPPPEPEPESHDFCLGSEYGREIETGIDEDHPEPSLLATSVGTGLDGRLIPSSSTISLLSLNTLAAPGPGPGPGPTEAASSNFGTSNISTNTNQNQNPAAKGTVAGLVHATAPERVASYTNLRSRNSITHLGQQRLQPYHHFASPVAAPAGEFAAVSSPQPIPWTKTASHMNTPDSPNLHPTSVGESPSRFWLSSQTPPAALAAPLAKSRPSFLGSAALGLTPIHSGSQPGPRPLGLTGSFTGNIGLSLNTDRGSRSPVLHPVSTPSEEVPMTPLYLSSEEGYSGFSGYAGDGRAGERRSDYFFGSGGPYTPGAAEDYHME